MRRNALLATLFVSAVSAHAAPPTVNFASVLAPNNAAWQTFNTSSTDTVTNIGGTGINIDGYIWDGNSGSGSSHYGNTNSFLWVKNSSNEHGLGVCSGSECNGMAYNTGGGGDVSNELDNLSNQVEVIRLTKSANQSWSDIWVSSLDSGGSGGHEKGTVFWSDNAYADLTTASSASFQWNAGDPDERSIWANVSSALDQNANYLFFRAGPNSSGYANDYLVMGVSTVTAVPEPETYAMLLAGLGLLGFAARRRKLKEAAAA